MIYGIVSRKNKCSMRFTDWIYHICIGLLPILYIFDIPVLDISLGTVILLAFIPRSLMYILKGIKRKKRISSFVFLFFYIYLILRSDGNLSRIVLCCAAYIIICGEINGAIDYFKLRTVIETFAIINVFLLVLQIFSYYLLHFQIQYIPRNIIHEEYQNSWVFRPFTGLYRPCALFLEPSHFSQFCIFALISALFPENDKANLKKAITIGIGCILTTSGMGIALAFGVFAWYVALRKQNIKKKILTFLEAIFFLVVVLLILSRTAFFQTALQRIFGTVDNYNAISGRTHNWDNSVGQMHGSLLWFGYGDSANFDLYLTGLADTIYKYGVLCVVLEGICFLHLMNRKRNDFIWCCCIVIMILFCVAHITNFVAQVFYFGILIANASSSKVNNPVLFQSVVPSVTTAGKSLNNTTTFQF